MKKEEKINIIESLIKDNRISIQKRKINNPIKLSKVKEEELIIDCIILTCNLESKSVEYSVTISWSIFDIDFIISIINREILKLNKNYLTDILLLNKND